MAEIHFSMCLHGKIGRYSLRPKKDKHEILRIAVLKKGGGLMMLFYFDSLLSFKASLRHYCVIRHLLTRCHLVSLGEPGHGQRVLLKQ